MNIIALSPALVVRAISGSGPARLFFFRTAAVCVCLSAWFPSGRAAADADITARRNGAPVVVAIDREYAPYEFVDPSGKARGFTPALLDEIGTVTGLDFEFQAMDWPEALAALKAGKVDLLNMIHTAERQRSYAFSEPHSQISQAIFCHQDGPFIDSLAALAGRRVALQRGDISWEILGCRTDFQRVIVKSKEEGFLLLNGGKVDAFLAAAYPGARIIAAYDLEHVIIGAVDLFPQDFCFAGDPARQDLIARLDAGLEQLKSDGRHDALLRKWIAPEPVPAPWLERHGALFLWIVGLTGGLVVLLFIFNRDLKRQVARRTVALGDSEALYRTLVENIDLGITLIDGDRRIVMANRAYADLFRTPRADLFGKDCCRGFGPEGGTHPLGPEAGAVVGSGPTEVVLTGVRDDHSTFTARLKVFPLIGAENRLGSYIEVVEDISLQIENETNLAAEKERLAVTLRSIGDGVICTDTRGVVTLINRAAEELTGWPESEAAGRPLAEVFRIVDEQSRETCRNPVERVLAAAGIVEMANHVILLTRDGRELSIADSGAPIRNPGSAIIGVVLVFRDVTGKRRTEAELLKVRKLESVGVLAGGIAHDFNNILTAILGNISLARLSSELKDDVTDLLREAERASLRAKGLTQQLLTFAKGGEPVKETALLQDDIRESADFILRGSNVACRYELCEDLWPVEVDRGQFSQVVQNIVLNAREAMPDGGMVAIRCENVPPEASGSPPLPDGHYIKVTISDTGPGVPETVVDRIFDPYFTTKQEGSGLGLALCYSIINRHDGRIVVQSVPGHGSTFTIHLPAVPRRRQENREEKPAALSARPVMVLVMDDDGSVRRTMVDMLKRLGHAVMEAADGVGAVRLYRESREARAPVDLVIMDLTIPGGMGGLEAVREILAIDPAARVICSSGYSTDPIMAHCRDHGFCGTLSKPYQLRELQDAVQRALATDCPG